MNILDCGTNAHKHCKDRVVMECRPKRNIGVTRQASSSGNVPIPETEPQKRNSFRKRAAQKQEETQNEAYGDIFLSDDSATSNEDTCTKMNTLMNSKIIDDETNYGSFEANTLITPNTNSKLNESFEQCPSVTSVNTQRTNRHRRYKKFSKRRKSLPSQGSSNEEPHPVTLIPRGPLICSNSESLNSWLPDKFAGSLNTTNTSNLSSVSSNLNNPDYEMSCNTSFNSGNNNSNIIRHTSNTKTSTLSNQDSYLKCPNITVDSHSPTTIAKVITKPKNRNNTTFRSKIPSTVDYDVNIIKTTIYNTSSSHTSGQQQTASTSSMSSSRPILGSQQYRSRIESDLYLNDCIDDYQIDDEVIDTTTYSSNDDDNNEIIQKLKEAEKVKIFQDFML